MKGLVGVRQLWRRQVDRVFIPISAGVADPNVSGAVIGEMFRPFRGNHLPTALRTLIH